MHACMTRENQLLGPCMFRRSHRSYERDACCMNTGIAEQGTVIANMHIGALLQNAHVTNSRRTQLCSQCRCCCCRALALRKSSF